MFFCKRLFIFGRVYFKPGAGESEVVDLFELHLQRLIRDSLVRCFGRDFFSDSCVGRQIRFGLQVVFRRDLFIQGVPDFELR